MGTRCDFYAGRGAAARYLGSIGQDAHLDVLAPYFAQVSSAEQFQDALARVFQARGEIAAVKGWPWPWRDSDTTDNVIAFDADTVWARHPNGFWAPLADVENTTNERCVFPDMVAAEEGSAQGRLRLRLRHRAGLALGPDQDALACAMVHAATLLARLWLHVFDKDGHYWVPELFWTSDRAFWTLNLFVDAMLGEDGEFEQMLGERRDTSGEAEWDLLTWLVTTRANVRTEGVNLVPASTYPVYFGQPLGGSSPLNCTYPLAYLRVLDTERLREGLALLDRVLNHIPGRFAYVVARQVRDMGCLPVPLKEADAWFEGAQPALDGLTLEAASASPEGRESVKKFAASLMLERCLPLDQEELL